jgi:ATP-binding cassette, subfamily F, member 3
MISAEQVKLNFGGFELFRGISFIVNPRDRIGLVGKNGAGKTTLMKMFAGLQTPTDGNIIVPKGITVGYLPQTMNIADTRTVFDEALTAFDHITDLENEIGQLNEELASRMDYESDDYHKLIQKITDKTDYLNLIGGNNFQSEIEKALFGLGFTRNDFKRGTAEFSGGWRMRIELAKLLLQHPDVFLLDEPTNHLDIESIQWLEEFLKNYKGAVMLVSHDKAFLDNITNRTIEISLGKIYDYKTFYSEYVKLRSERREQQLAAYRNQQKMIQDTEEFIERFRYKATKAVQVQSRIKQLDKVDLIEIDEEDNSRLNIKFPPAPRSGKMVVEIKSLSKWYGNHQVLDHIDLIIEQGEKLAFVGKNGEGKTTLAKIIMNEIEHQGTMKIGYNVKIGYFAQNQADLLDGELTVLETIDKVATGEIRTKIRDLLGAFMFSGEEVDKKVKVLSGGERTRLAMVRLMLEPVNLLIMDEPTNHLDMRSKEILKQALRDFSGTLLLVSHDRDFLDGLVNCVYEFSNRKTKQHLGGIYDFINRKKIESLRDLEKKTLISATDKKASAKPLAPDEFSFEVKKEINKQITRLSKLVEQCENTIGETETEMEEVNKQLSRPENADQKLYTQYDVVKTKLETLFVEWEALHDQLEEWKNKKNW